MINLFVWIQKEDDQDIRQNANEGGDIAKSVRSTELERLNSRNLSLQSEIESIRKERDNYQDIVDTISTEYENLLGSYREVLRHLQEKVGVHVHI